MLCIFPTVIGAVVLRMICLYFIFQMQGNANELQYPEATEAKTHSILIGVHFCTLAFAILMTSVSLCSTVNRFGWCRN